MAESKGMSMVGNSWYGHDHLICRGLSAHHCRRIHKSKYNDDDTCSSPKEKNRKKARSKSRTRAMFGLKPGS